MSEQEARDPGSLLKGVGIGVAATVAGGMLLMMGGIFLLIGIGAIEWVWMLPLYLHFDKKGAKETAKGILISGGIVFLLNATCFGLVMSGGIKIGG